MTVLWRHQELSMLFDVAHAANWTVTGCAIDSREVVPGDLFIALKGTQSDGHDHVLRAFDRGAVAALVQHTPDTMAPHDPRLVRCEDTFAGLKALGQAARARSTAQIVAVTGSAGKTGVCRLLADALSRSAKTHASVRSFNNHVGVPLSLARMPKQARFAVFELGMNAPGEIAALAAQVRPHMGLVTTIGAAHKAAFEDLAGIAREKASLFAHVQAGGAAIVNLDSPHSDILLQAAQAGPAKQIVTASLTDQAVDVFAQKYALAPEATCMTVQLAETRLMTKVAAPGHAWALNGLLVLAAVKALGGDLGLAGLALAGLELGPGRGQSVRLAVSDGHVWLLDHSYNANPASLRAALEMLAAQEAPAGGRRIAILGDMLELGADAQAEHLACADALKAAYVNQVFAFGPLTVAMANAASVPVVRVRQAEDFAPQLLRQLRDGDCVLIKGSNAMGLGRLVAALKDSAGAQMPTHAWSPMLEAAA